MQPLISITSPTATVILSNFGTATDYDVHNTVGLPSGSKRDGVANALMYGNRLSGVAHRDYAERVVPLYALGTDGGDAATIALQRAIDSEGARLIWQRTPDSVQLAASIHTATLTEDGIDLIRAEAGKKPLVLVLTTDALWRATTGVPFSVSGTAPCVLALDDVPGDAPAACVWDVLSGSATNAVGLAIQPAPDAAYDPIDTYASSTLSLPASLPTDGSVVGTPPSIDMAGNRGGCEVMARFSGPAEWSAQVIEHKTGTTLSFPTWDESQARFAQTFTLTKPSRITSLEFKAAKGSYNITSQYLHIIKTASGVPKYPLNSTNCISWFNTGGVAQWYDDVTVPTGTTPTVVTRTYADPIEIPAGTYAVSFAAPYTTSDGAAGFSGGGAYTLYGGDPSPSWHAGASSDSTADYYFSVGFDQRTDQGGILVRARSAVNGSGAYIAESVAAEAEAAVATTTASQAWHRVGYTKVPAAAVPLTSQGDIGYGTESLALNQNVGTSTATTTQTQTYTVVNTGKISAVGIYAAFAAGVVGQVVYPITITASGGRSAGASITVPNTTAAMHKCVVDDNLFGEFLVTAGETVTVTWDNTAQGSALGTVYYSSTTQYAGGARTGGGDLRFAMYERPRVVSGASVGLQAAKLATAGTLTLTQLVRMPSDYGCAVVGATFGANEGVTIDATSPQGGCWFYRKNSAGDIGPLAPSWLMDKGLLQPRPGDNALVVLGEGTVTVSGTYYPCYTNAGAGDA